MPKSAALPSAVKRKVLNEMEALFATEDQRVPYSDVEISEHLCSKGLKITESGVAYNRETFFNLPAYRERAKLYRQQKGK